MMLYWFFKTGSEIEIFITSSDHLFAIEYSASNNKKWYFGRNFCVCGAFEVFAKTGYQCWQHFADKYYNSKSVHWHNFYAFVAKKIF